MVQSDLFERSSSSLLRVADRLTKARIKFAEEYIRHKAMHQKDYPVTDKTAEMMAVIDTQSETTLLEAQLEVARRALEYATKSTP